MSAVSNTLGRSLDKRNKKTALEFGRAETPDECEKNYFPGSVEVRRRWWQFKHWINGKEMEKINRDYFFHSEN